MGNHPLWEIFRSVYQMTQKPYFVGGFLVLVAYLWSRVRGVKRTMPDELMALRRSDQMKRLKQIVGRRFHPVASVV